MADICWYSRCLLFISVLALLPGGMHNANTENVGAVKGIIGAIVDYSTRIGKEEMVAMQMAVEDLNSQTKQQLLLLVKNSRGEALQATLAARHLINKKQVQAILGPQSWEETSLVAEVGSQYNIPILSFADSCPSWAINRWPFLIEASPSKNLQMKAVAAIAQSWGWRHVNVIYEDIDSFVNDITPHLYDALREIGAQISHLTPLPSLAAASLLTEELEKLKREQCRVFVVHASLPLALSLFHIAKEMKMMEQGYVWITTDSITSLVHSMNVSTISSMQGVLGVKSYHHAKGLKYQEFYQRFHDKFGLKYPEEQNHEPGNYALQAYDAIWTVALAKEGGDFSRKDLLDKLSIINFDGISGKIQFSDQRLAPVNVFQIINVIGRSYRELGFWSEKIGFSMTLDDSAQTDVSMGILGQFFWPGGSPVTPRGWDIPTFANPLMIGVPNSTLNEHFVIVKNDPFTNNYIFSGFSIDIFRETVKRLPYSLPYRFIPFGGTFDDLVEQVRLKQFDAAVGDIAIVSERYVNADFTQPHMESNLMLIVPIQSKSNKGLLFLKPFTKTMWLLIASANIYNGFVIWMIERKYCSELKGSPMNQIGNLLWLAFATLFSLRGERLNSNLSRMATLVWLFVALVISQSYMASLTSMLTVSRLEPKVANIETLRNSNSLIGYSRKGFAKNYLVDVLHFNSNNIRNFSTFEECAEGLKTGNIAAALLDAPAAKFFLAKYCKSFMATGPTYKFGGYGYAFPKGSPLIADIDEALLKVFETGTLKELEDKLIASEKCVDIESDNETLSLSPSSFYVLFLFTGGISTVALAIYVFHSKCGVDNSMPTHKQIWLLALIVFNFWRKQIWLLMLIVFNFWKNQKSRVFRKVSHAESAMNSPTHDTSHGSNPEYSA